MLLCTESAPSVASTVRSPSMLTGTGQRARVELQRQQARLIERQAGDDAAVLSTAWTVGAEIC